MLKSCVRPCQVLIGNRHLTVKQSVAFRYVIVPTQLREQLRHKSSKTRGQQSRWDKGNRTSNATEPPAPSKTNPPSRETKTETPQKPHKAKSKPESSSQAKDKIRFRPLLTDPVRPTPNQDLSSTRPAELEKVLPPEQDEYGNVPIAARAKYFYRLGKSYVNFYKTGVKKIWNNRKEYNEIKARLGSYPLLHAALYGGQVVYRRNDGTKVEVEKVPIITRREYQLCLRTKHDLGKLLPFGLVFAICGEFTPLVILALGSSVVPYTCRIPKQVQHDRRWFVKRLEDNTLERVKQEQGTAEMERVESPEFVNSLAFLHGVSPVARLPPVIGRLFFHFWVQPRLVRRGWEVLADTILIRREGGFRVLEPAEVYEYANKFFCPQLVWASQLQLKRFGTIDWVPEIASSFGDMLEKHATLMLARDWERIPEESRYHSGLILDGGTLSRSKAVEEEINKTRKLPR